MSTVDPNSVSRGARSRRSRVGVERAGPQHAERLHEFFVREWGGSYEPGTRPDVMAPQWVCLREDEIIGYLGTIPVTFQLDGAPVPGHWLKGFWVTEAYRSGPVGHMLVEKALGELDIVGSHVVADPARRVLESLGLSHRCTLFDRVLLLRPGRVLNRVDLAAMASSSGRRTVHSVAKALQSAGALGAAGTAAGWGLRLLGGIADARVRGLRARRGWDVPADSLDDVWERLASQVALTPVRDARTLLARYASGGVYELLSVWRDERMEGWAILRRPGSGSHPKLPGVRLALIADILFPLGNGAVGVAAARAAEMLAREQGADALVCSGSHSRLERMLALRGYVKLAGTVRILVRDGQSRPFPSTADGMWLTRGDARSDEGF